MHKESISYENYTEAYWVKCTDNYDGHTFYGIKPADSNSVVCLCCGKLIDCSACETIETIPIKFEEYSNMWDSLKLKFEIE